MFQKARESSFMESTSLLVRALRWRKPLLIVSILAAVGSFIFSGESFIKPKYKSSVVFFPTATNSISKALMDEHVSDKQDILAFGEEEQAEQLLQILNSDEIRDIIVQKYHLLQHYGIDSMQQFPMTALVNEFNDNISFQRTEFMSVRIDVLDNDPQMAANIANDIAALLDSMKSKIQHARAFEALKIIGNTYDEKLVSMKAKEDSLKSIRKRGITDNRNQALVWNEQYAKAYAAYSNEAASLDVLQKLKSADDTAVINTRARMIGSQANLKNLQSKLNALAEYGGASISLSEELTLDREAISKLKDQYEKLKVDAVQNLPHKFIVNKAVKAERKSYPIRWLIVLISTSCAFLLAFIVLLIIDRAKDLSYKI